MSTRSTMRSQSKARSLSSTQRALNHHRPQVQVVGNQPVPDESSTQAVRGNTLSTTRQGGRTGSLPTLASHAQSISTTAVGAQQRQNSRRPATATVAADSKGTGPKFLKLQDKARAGFKKLLQTEGRIERQTLAFFFLKNTVCANGRVYDHQILDLKIGMAPFKTNWFDFNKPLISVPQYPG